MKASFDLIDSPWIPCLDADGARVELGLRDTLARAHELSDLRDESPLTTAALLRLLQAVLYAALEGPADDRAWRALWKAGSFSAARLDRYFKEWRDRFDLFDEKHPFFQVGGFEITGKEGSPVTKLTHQLAAGNSATLFDHTIEERKLAVTPAVAARWLVTCQSFAVSGGAGAASNRFERHPYTMHAPMVGGVAVLLLGRTLFETLALNLVPLSVPDLMPTRGNDRPSWEQHRVDEPGKRRPRGIMEFLSWRSRMVRLLPEGPPDRVVVSDMHYASGWGLEDGVLNPAFGYSLDKTKGPRPIGLSEGRALWRDSAALLADVNQREDRRNRRPLALRFASHLVELEVLPLEATLQVLALGMANDKKQVAKILLWRRETWSIPARLIQDPEAAARALGALADAEMAGVAVRSAFSEVANELCSAFRPKERNEYLRLLRRRGESSYWSALDRPFRELLTDLGREPESAIASWRSALLASARRAVAEAADNMLGRSARELGARVGAERILARELHSFTHREERTNGDA